MQKQNKLSDLRDHLFETLERLKDPEKPMEVDRAKAICNVAAKLIDTAKIEVKAAEVVGAGLSDFLESSRKLPLPALPAAPLGPVRPPASRVVDPLRTVKPEPPNGREKAHRARA